MLANFTFQDILGTDFAFCLFPLALIFPVYVFGWVFNLFEFRARLLSTRFAVSLLLSIAVVPILYYLVTSWFSLRVALFVTFYIALLFIFLIIYEKPAFLQRGSWRALLLILFGWFCPLYLWWICNGESVNCISALHPTTTPHAFPLSTP